MPVISEITGVPRSRFGFHQPSDSDSVASSPAIPKSVSKGSLFLSSSKSNAAERDEDHRGVVVSRSLSQSFELQEDPSFWTSHNVQVIIRIRPLSNSEISLQGHNKCVRQDSCQTITWLGHPESRFTFDLIADENVTQENLFKVAGYPMVDNCMGGYNSCMFAYGQTGSGKTHTMLGDIEGGTRRHSANCGMTPRVFEHLFTRIQKEKESRRDEKLRFTCKCSFLEIYNEQILDLLDPSSANLQIREDAKKGVYVENLTELEVTSARDVMQQLLQGAANRKVAATNMNLASSRSHSVFTCIIESQWESQGVTHHRFARLNLVDLAGSERQKSSGAEGERLKEATNINKSLSTLGLVIMNLVNISNGKSLHVPYRDSKLTFLLQDSLGGNSKTIIIANISPSNCNSLETLSTLKFAQRAKFIKNNAIVNEDASGDVLAMRMQIQQLKKEISRLRGLADGGTENHETDNWAISFPGSPGSFKWEGLNGSFSPLTSGKRASQKKEFEAALVGAFRRERDKEIALQALTAENQASMHLAKQREDEIQGLKMRLRFREAGIKRLEGVASGKMSAEAHLLQEREEHMKEMEVLKNQLDRNQEATRFAMENLRLKEEIRRLKSFYEEGEQERMNEQIMTLQNKLLEALDWKLMHESDPGVVQKGSSELEMLEGSLLSSSKESTSAWNSCISEENEFLRMQAIQNQSEMETLHKKLNACLEEKEKLDRRIEDLVLELEEEKRSAKSMKEEAKQQFQASLQFTSGIPDQPSDVAPNDQTELKTIVDAIAAASQQEAEAHETAITLAKENDELRRKLKVLIEDNSKLIELYEGAVADVSKRKDSEEQKTDNLCNAATDIPDKDDVGMAKTIVHLEQQIQDLHEENERLITLYENAMQERDDYIRKFRSSGQYNPNVNEVDNCPEKLVEVDIGENLMFENLSLDCGDTNLSPGKIGFSVLSDMDESDDTPLKATSEENQMEVQTTYECSDQSEVQTNALASVENANTQTKSSNITQLEVSEEFLLARNKLEKVNVKLTKAAKDLTVFGSLEMAIVEADTLSKEIEVAEKDIRIKQQETVDLKNLSSEIENRKHIVDRKISALKSSISSISSSLFYWEEREGRKRTKVDSATRYVKQKKEKLVQLQVQWDELDAAQQKAQHYVGDLRNHLVSTRSKLEEENRRKESEKVLLTIDNFDRTDAPSQRNWNFGGKAIELLKSQEERTILQAEVKQSQEKLDIALKEVEVLKTKYEKLKTEVQATEGGISSGLQAVKEMELEFQEANQEKEMLLEMIMDGQKEVDELILEYFECVFGSDLKDGEIKILEEEQETERTQLEKSRVSMVAAMQKEVQFLQEARHPFMVANEPSQRWSLSEKMEEELQEILMDVQEAKLLLGGDCR